MVRRPAGDCRFDPLKSQSAKIQFINVDVNDSHWIGVHNIVIESFREQRTLRPAFPLNESLHPYAPT